MVCTKLSLRNIEGGILYERADNIRPEFVEKLIWGRRGRRPLQNFSRIIDKL